MEKYVSWPQILGAFLMGLVFILFIVIPAMWYFGYCFFSATTKIIKGKILNLFVGKVVLEGKILAVEFYVVIEDNNSRYPKQVKIPKEIFAELNRKRKLVLEKNILLYFKDYFFKNYFDHYEIA